MENKLSNFEILNKLGIVIILPMTTLGSGAYSTVFKV